MGFLSLWTGGKSPWIGSHAFQIPADENDPFQSDNLTPLMSPDDLEKKLSERPFQSFRIKLSNNSSIDVHSPGDLVMGDTSVTLPLETRRDDQGYEVIRSWRTISIAHIVEFIDIEPPKNRRR